MSEYMPESMSDRMTEKTCRIHFQMACQKLCQNSVSRWGSLEDFFFKIKKKTVNTGTYCK